jgi:diacylglycerol kinase
MKIRTGTTGPMPDDSWTVKDTVLWVVAHWPTDFFSEPRTPAKVLPDGWISPVVDTFFKNGLPYESKLRKKFLVATTWAAALSISSSRKEGLNLITKVSRAVRIPPREVEDLMNEMLLEGTTEDFLANNVAQLAYCLAETAVVGTTIIQTRLLQEMIRTTGMFEQINDAVEEAIKRTPPTIGQATKLLSAYASAADAVQKLIIPLAAWGEPDSYFDGAGAKKDAPRRRKAARDIVDKIKALNPKA